MWAKVIALLSPIDRRELAPGILSKGIFILGGLIGLYHLYALAIWRSYPLDLHLALHLLPILMLGLLAFPYSQKKTSGLSLIDIVILLIALAVVIYFFINLGQMEERKWGAVVVEPTILDYISGALLMLLALELVRRSIGLMFVILIIGFLLILHFGPYLPGRLAHAGFSWPAITEMCSLSYCVGFWDMPLRISATIITLFLIFGKLLQHSGIGDLLIPLSQAIAGGARGGPAKVAVIGSGFVGSFTGGPISNVVMTGTFTIPMMKKVGYEPAYAGGVECAASTGASIMPPIMTGVMFIMVELTGIPFVKLMVVAFIPAVFYFLAILLQVHFQSIKLGMVGAPPAERKEALKQALAILKERGHLVMPLVILVILLVMDFTATEAVIWSILSVVLVSWLSKKTRMGPKKIFIAISEGVQNLVQVALVCAFCGIVMYGLFITGISGVISYAISDLAHGLLLPVILMAGILCIILGMGVPVIAAYLVTILLVGPVILDAGVPTIVTHFFSLYYANLGFITPPVALGAFIAAGICGASFWRVGFIAIRLAIAGFIIPIAFVFRPAILLLGSPLEIIWAVFILALIVLCAASTLEGQLLKKLNIFERLLLVTAMVILLVPNLPMNIVGIILLVSVLIWQGREKIMLRIYEGAAHHKRGSLDGKADGTLKRSNYNR